MEAQGKHRNDLTCIHPRPAANTCEARSVVTIPLCIVIGNYAVEGVANFLSDRARLEHSNCPCGTNDLSSAQHPVAHPCHMC